MADKPNQGTGTGYLEEFPFSVANYLGSEDPDNSDETGNFIDCVFFIFFRQEGFPLQVTCEPE